MMPEVAPPYTIEENKGELLVIVFEFDDAGGDSGGCKEFEHAGGVLLPLGIAAVPKIVLLLRRGSTWGRAAPKIVCVLPLPVCPYTKDGAVISLKNVLDNGCANIRIDFILFSCRVVHMGVDELVR